MPPILVFAPAVNVPALNVKLPDAERVAGGVNPPADTVTFAAFSVVVLPPTDKVPPPLLTIRLLKVCDATEPLIA